MYFNYSISGKVAESCSIRISAASVINCFSVFVICTAFFLCLQIVLANDTVFEDYWQMQQNDPVFIENKGQWDEDVQFCSFSCRRTFRRTLFLQIAGRERFCRNKKNVIHEVKA